jgi:hypothetical protein
VCVVSKGAQRSGIKSQIDEACWDKEIYGMLKEEYAAR